MMKKIVYLTLALLVCSCSMTLVADYSSKSIKSKGKKIDWIEIQEYPLSNLISVKTVGINPMNKNCEGEYLIAERYFLENRYYETLVNETFSALQKTNRYKDRLNFLDDSLLKVHPKPDRFKEINLLTDDSIKFKKYVDDNFDNFHASEESYTLKKIIKPNHFYVVKWGNSKMGRGTNSHSTYSSADWLEFKVNEKREIIYWKEMTSRIHLDRGNKLKNL
jgi:hypothetical protein